jgi:predicted RNA-binding protein (virulence factor B family)
MLIPGQYYTLTVARDTDHGQFLVDDDGDDILLPKRYVTDRVQPGDPIEVFVYTDSEDRPVATTERPLLLAGQAAWLEAVDKNVHGAFFDWGLTAKNLFMPLRNTVGRIDVGKRYIVYMYVDTVSGRLTATAKLNPFIRNEELSVAPGDAVDVLVAQKNDLGYRVIVDNRHWGMIYTNQIFSPVSIGDRLKGYVTRVTEDNRIDISLQKQGFDEVKDAADRLLALLREHNGKLPVGDKSDPEEVSRLTQMSKKVFKRAVGTLLKQGRITTTDRSVESKEKI